MQAPDADTIRLDIHAALIAGVVAGLVTAVMLEIFLHLFQVPPPPHGTCETFGRARYGHEFFLEGSGPYEHKHCVDPETRAMYLPEAIAP